MQVHFTVLSHQLANYVGSGSLPVLSTPWLVAFVENAAVRFLRDQLEDNETTVGAHVELDHLAPSLEGEDIIVNIELAQHKKRFYEFSFEATCQGKLIGKGRHCRVKVDSQSFMTHAKSKS